MIKNKSGDLILSCIRLGTIFEKTVMSVITIIGFCFDIRIAFEKEVK